MNKNQVKGSMKEAEGKVQKAVGGMTGDTSTKAKGAAKEAAGKAQKAAGNVQESVKKALKK